MEGPLDIALLALLWLTRLFAAALLIGTLIPFIRSGWWFIRGWDFPRIQLAALCVLAAAALYGWTFRYGWLPDLWILMVLLGLAAVWQLSHVARYTPLWPKRVAPSKEHDLRLVVANLDVRNDQHEAVANALMRTNPDALLLIELDDAWNRALADVRSRFHHHVEHLRPEGHGIALWSNAPIERSQIRHLVSEDRPSIDATLLVRPQRRIHFIGVHPVPPGLPTENGSEGGEKGAGRGGARHDSRVRDAELTIIAREVAQDRSLDTVVAGDFNDVAWSHTTRLFEDLSGLADPRIGRGLYNTYHAERPLLRYPLDHVFVSPSFGAQHLERVELPGSDHFGILIDLELRRGPSSLPEADSDDREQAEEMVEEGFEDAAEQGEAAGRP